MRGVNKAIIVGNLGADPEVRYMPSGGAVANVSIATTRGWRDKQTGEMKEQTEWHRVVFFNRLGEIAGQYLKKGSQVYIEGRIQTRKWQGQDGQDHWTTEIIANEMQMLGSRPAGGTTTYEQGGGYGGQAQGSNAPPPQDGNTAMQGGGNAPPGPPPAGNQAPNPSQPVKDDFDDDIPF